ncbi:hypothetical protein HERIO_2494 [Hepatospora eriocheir]|uniref:Uncharacterized protein n=1 Tax=Hepatospora eriocheir TaxID=1081669 RepID=A0A1X0Q6R5_9MICR|nr:hypothetical protein HERIO_2494 [Hepatospora eriocheir]
MIWYILFLKLNNSTNEVSSDTVENKNTNLKRKQNEFDNQPVSEKAKKINKTDNEEESSIKRQKTDETSKMSGETITGELEEPITFEEFKEIIGIEGLEEIMEPDAIEEIMKLDPIKEMIQSDEFEKLTGFYEQTQFNELEKAGSTQKIILYPHITEETFSFFKELDKRFNVPSSDDINQQYKENIYRIIQRKDFSFPITTKDFYKILKTKAFNKSELEKIANLDLNTIQSKSNKLNFFECFLLRFVHILTYQNYKDYKEENIEIINILIDLLNEYIKFYSYFLKLKEVVIMINNDDIENLQTTKEEFIDLIDKNFLSRFNSLTKDEKFNEFENFIGSINRYLKSDAFFINEEIGGLNLFEYFKDISKSFDDRLDKNNKKKILKLISYIYLGYIHFSCKIDLIKLKKCYFTDEKSKLLRDFINLMNRVPWNIDE